MKPVRKKAFKITCLPVRMPAFYGSSWLLRALARKVAIITTKFAASGRPADGVPAMASDLIDKDPAKRA